jgi:hypothetical protein
MYTSCNGSTKPTVFITTLPLNHPAPAPRAYAALHGGTLELSELLPTCDRLTRCLLPPIRTPLLRLDQKVFPTPPPRQGILDLCQNDLYTHDISNELRGVQAFAAPCVNVAIGNPPLLN